MFSVHDAYMLFFSAPSCLGPVLCFIGFVIYNTVQYNTVIYNALKVEDRI